ncbi:magnesium transporter [Chloroflexota bacterium]
MKKGLETQDNILPEEGVPLNEEETEDIAEHIQNLVEDDKQPEAIEILSHLHPADQGEVIDELPVATQQQLLVALPPEDAAEILEHLEIEDIAMITEGMDTSVISDILDEADSDVQADVLRQLPKERAQDILEDMEEVSDALSLLEFPDDSAGGIMVREYVAVQETDTTANALDALRQREPEIEDIRSIFVVDSEGRLKGELGLARLALSRPKTIVGNAMDSEILFINSDTDHEECARVMQHYNLDQLPVVDSEKHLLGIIMSEDVIDVVSEQATEDMYKLAGIVGERVSGSISVSIRNRLPWLTLNLITTFLAALVISFFESTIARVVALAIFLPVVAGQGGIGGTQTLTLVIRSMALGELTKRGGIRLLGREVVLGIIHGLVLGLAVGLAAYLWKGNYMLGIVLGLAMIGNMIIAGLTGAGVPLLLTRLKIDPALSSAVIVTTCTDVVGFLLFLGLATALIRFLL